jgi:DNA-directed RNA polymerase specialized sigma24 family protein
MRSIDDVADDHDWGETYRRLLAYSINRLGRASLADAEQITQEALAQLFDHEHYDWDPDGGVALIDDLGSRVNGLVSNLRRKDRRRGIHVELEDDVAGGGSPSPETRAADGEEARQAVADLLSRVDGDNVCEDVVLHMADGLDRPADVAAKTGRDVREIYNARRRLLPHIAAVAATLGRSTS